MKIILWSEMQGKRLIMKQTLIVNEEIHSHISAYEFQIEIFLKNKKANQILNIKRICVRLVAPRIENLLPEGVQADVDLDVIFLTRHLPYQTSHFRLWLCLRARINLTERL